MEGADAAAVIADARATLAVLATDQAQLFRKLLSNVLGAPGETKFRRLNLGNAKIGGLLIVPEVRRAFEAFGWRDADDATPSAGSRGVMELPPEADLGAMRAVLEEGGGEESLQVTVLQGPLRKRVDVPRAGRVGHLSLAIERSRDFASMPRSRQLLLAGYPPKPLEEPGSKTLAELGVKSVMLEDRWERLVSSMRSCRASFSSVAAVLRCPVLRQLALEDNRDFLRDRIIETLKGRLSEVPAEELLAARFCFDEVLVSPGDASEELKRRREICAQAAVSASKRRRRRPLPAGLEGLAQPMPELGELAESMIEIDEDDEPEAKFVLTVERARIYETATSQVAAASTEELRRALEVRFEGEVAEDAGGLRREFFNEFGRGCMGDAARGLWQLTPIGSLVPAPPEVAALRCPSAAERATSYRSCGRIFGIALLEGARPPQQPLLLGLPLAIGFLHVLQGRFAESVDELQSILNAEQREDAPDFRGSTAFRQQSLKESGLEDQLTFSYALPANAGAVELLPGGGDVVVTDTSKEQWLKATLRYELVDNLREAADSFRAGVCEMVSATHLVLLSAEALREAWSGHGVISDADLQTWQSQTVVSPAVSKQAEWFFELLQNELKGVRARVLKFSTGSDRWPVDPRGFKYVIEPRDGEDSALPCAMTCGNMLQLPRYSSREPLRDRLLQALDSGVDLALK